MIPIELTIATSREHPYCLTFKVDGERIFRAFSRNALREFYIGAVLQSCATEIASFDLRPDRLLS